MSVSGGHGDAASEGDAPDRETVERLAVELRAFLGDRVSDAAAVRQHHGGGEDRFPRQPPDLVCFPETTDEVSRIVRRCADHGVPVIPFGAGTSVEGHVLAHRGGVSVDLTRMDRILEVSLENLDCQVEAGVTRVQLEERLGPNGLFFPVDPGADATLGGMAATGASGTTTVRYGTMRENVLGLTVVLADGRVIRTGGRARKSSAGYDLTRLLIGSEGTLGVVTELWLRLRGIPEAISAAVCQFPDLDAAVITAIETIQTGVQVARIELLDRVQMMACKRRSDLGDLEELPTLFFEFHGSPRSVGEDARSVEEISGRHDGSNFAWATDAADRKRLWTARHEAYYAALALEPGKRAVTTDVCVPIARLAECIRRTRADIDDSDLTVPIVGHVGDGNFHLVILVDPEDPDELERAEELNRRLVERALRMGGTCTGEHGIGRGKIEYLEAEHGDAIETMRAVKSALDPDGILNPGKVLPEAPDHAERPR